MDEQSTERQTYRERRRVCNPGASNTVYALGFIGAVIYFVQHAASFWLGVFGVLKAIIWPVLLIYKLLEFLKM